MVSVWRLSKSTPYYFIADLNRNVPFQENALLELRFPNKGPNSYKKYH